MAIEMEDDLFFADLSKQIALLIMDDDEEFPVQSQPVHLQAYHHHHLSGSVVPPPYAYEMAYRRESKGTGVFIPRSSLPRRKNRSGKSTSNNNSNSNNRKNNNKSEANNSRLHSNYYANSGALKNHRT
ncbi:uncharacterized protein M6B38_413080 [Iris pallida]|uniref:Uncharacterized protein n=1 Tax=Iris pallida TaxID=29817 RepID=A0AAX6FLU6_IRIPA|nr:uncharacterized protein M6B38_413080 [Iris pallida]